MTVTAPPTLTVPQIRYYAYKAGFRDKDQTTITAIALAESGGNPHARNSNTDGSTDRGLLQINSKYHAEVTDAQADDPAKAMIAAYRISSQGTDFTPWSTYEEGAYRQFMGIAAGVQAKPPLEKKPNPPAPGPMRTVLIRPFIAPTVVTQPFGPTSVLSEPVGYYLPDLTVCYDAGHGLSPERVHCGVDYALPQGHPLIAPAPGAVLLAGWSPSGFGNRTVIDHGDVLTLYGHQQDITVVEGQAVEKGDVIGHVGTTGNSSGPHLHWSCLDGPLWRQFSRVVYLDPARYVYGW